MANPTIAFDDAARVTTVNIDAPILTNGRLNLCLVQTAPLGLAVIEGDQSRPAVVAAVRDLLVGDGAQHPTPALRDLVPGNDTVVIVAPEYAFGSGDWHAIDVLVRQSPQPVILIAGFGATTADVLLDWAALAVGDDATQRHVSWDQAVHPIATARPVNGAWCWLHGLGFETQCVAFLKNHFEQQMEAVHLPALQSGRMMLHLQFQDADLFPMICADLIQPIAEGNSTAQARLEACLRPTRGQNRPVLVVGLLLQPQYNINWEAAIDAVLNTVTIGRPATIALCNVAIDAPVQNEAQDKWRTLTGVYGRFTDLPKNQRDLPAGRAIEARGIRGAVVRLTESCIVAGPVSWAPYNPVSGLFIWHAEMSCAATPSGIAAPIGPPPPPVACEVARFIRRQPAQNGWSPRVQLGLNGLLEHLATGTLPDAQRLLCTLLDGVGGVACADPDQLHHASLEQALRSALYALATLTTANDLDWQTEVTRDGQLRLAEHDLHILVWRDANRTPKQMLRELGAWKTQPGEHPNLIVLGESPHGSPAEGPVASARRDDITQGPTLSTNFDAGGALLASPDDFTQPRAERNVACLRLENVTAVYTDYVQAEDQVRMVALLNRITALFTPAASA